MTRREFLAASATLTAASAQEPSADIVNLRIAPITLDIGRKRTIKTLAYNGQVPGPVFRWKENQRVTIDVANDTSEPELVHWHGFHIPSVVDGAMEEGTPMIGARATQRYSFTVNPAGTRWYHSHLMGSHNYQRGTYSGQFGLAIIEAAGEPGNYDQDIPLMIHEWEASLSEDEIVYRYQSINGKMLGAGEPVRVKAGQRILFRLVNASATMTHSLALTGHSMNVIALDGNTVPSPGLVRAVELGPGERADCMVEMNNPGVWILGETNDAYRNAGAGIVVEYAAAQGAPRWVPPPPAEWDYTRFGTSSPSSTAPDATVPLQFKSHGDHGWTINGKAWPRTDPLVVKQGARYRLVFDNQSSMAHPVHLHRHRFEITKFGGKPTGGVLKDVVMVPGWKEVEVDLIAANPGPSLFHCHHQFHMDQGFMALMKYS